MNDRALPPLFDRVPVIVVLKINIRIKQITINDEYYALANKKERK